LTIANNSTTASAVINVASLGGVGNGATNISIKNANIRGGTNTVANVFGIVNSTTASLTAAGEDNDNLTIENNNITRVYRAIVAASNNTAGAIDNLRIIGTLLVVVMRQLCWF
jgi:hypothetical protein